MFSRNEYILDTDAWRHLSTRTYVFDTSSFMIVSLVNNVADEYWLVRYIAQFHSNITISIMRKNNLCVERIHWHCWTSSRLLDEYQPNGSLHQWSPMSVKLIARTIIMMMFDTFIYRMISMTMVTINQS
jgi:hypothetical protein